MGFLDSFPSPLSFVLYEKLNTAYRERSKCQQYYWQILLDLLSPGHSPCWTNLGLASIRDTPLTQDTKQCRILLLPTNQRQKREGHKGMRHTRQVLPFKLSKLTHHNLRRESERSEKIIPSNHLRKHEARGKDIVSEHNPVWKTAIKQKNYMGT